MARLKVGALVLLPLLALAGCSELFDFNAYSGLEPAAVADPARYKTSSGLDNLDTDLSSPSVVDALKADTVKTDQIASDLVTTYSLTGAILTLDQQHAAILYGDLELKTTSGEAFVNSLFSELAGGTIPATIETLLQSTLPADALGSPTVFADMVDALLAANDVYGQLSAGFTDTDGNGVIDPGEGVPAGTNMGDVAQKMAVAYTMGVVSEQLVTAGVAAGDVSAQLYLLATDPASPDLDPAVAGMTFDFSANLAAINTMLGYAGMTLPSL